MIKALFFDLDGTLVDTHKANYGAYRKAVSQFGTDLTYSKFLQSIGHEAQTFLPWLAPGLKKEDYEEIAKLKKDYYKDFMGSTKGNAHLISFLKSMKQAHVIVLVTTAKRANAQTVLRHHELEEYFDYVVTSDDVSASKPDPECYLLALQKCGIKPNEALAFEDSEPGILAAEAAGINVIRVGDFSDDIT